MSRILGRNIEPNTIESDRLTSAAKADIRSGKLIAGRNAVTLFTFPASSSADVTSQVTAASSTLSPITDLSTKGIYVGTITGQTDAKRVQIRLAGTDNGLDDGTGDDAFGVLTESGGVYTLSLKKADGSVLTLGSPTDIDFYFAEVFDLDTAPVDLLLILGSVGGVIDAASADAAVVAQAAADAAQVDATQALSDAATAQATADNAETIATHADDTIESYSNILKILEHPSNKKRIIINPAVDVLPDGSTLIAEMNQFRIVFAGAQVDFSNGNIYNFAGDTIVDTFTPPTITDTFYRWVSVNLLPSTLDSQNRMTVILSVLAAGTEDANKDAAERPAFLTGKPLGQIALQGQSGSVADILYGNIERLSFGSGGGSVTSIIKEVPTGTIDGVNDTFTLSTDPVDQASTFVFLDGIYVRNSQFTLTGDTIVFVAPPQPGQEIDVFFYPDPLAGLGGGGGSTDLTNIAVDISPSVAGAQSVGSTTKPWKEVIVKDKTTSDVWRIEVDNGVLQAVLVE